MYETSYRYRVRHAHSYLPHQKVYMALEFANTNRGKNHEFISKYQVQPFAHMGTQGGFFSVLEFSYSVGKTSDESECSKKWHIFGPKWRYCGSKGIFLTIGE